MSWQAAFRDQAASCQALGSPFTARLLGLLADRGLPPGAIRDRIEGWTGDISSRGQSVALRLAGALHGLVIEGRAPDLARVYPPHDVPDARLVAAVADALRAEASWILARLAQAPQTNEVARSAVLIAAARWLAAVTGQPLVLSELGASAGLNLLFDRYALASGAHRVGPAEPVLTLRPDWRGRTPAGADPTIKARRGVDLCPIDPGRDRLRLLSYIWADQTDRLARAGAALDEACRHPGLVECGDAIDFLARRLDQVHAGACHMVFHTIAWQYFPAAAQQRGRALLAAAGAVATRAAPLAHLGMEADGSAPGAGIRLVLWPGNYDIALGRADFHGRWVDWQAPDPREFRW